MAVRYNRDPDGVRIDPSMNLLLNSRSGTAESTTSLPTEISTQSVRDQLVRLLASHPFQNSKRYPRFLTYIVEQTLAGNREQLKERILGIEVFDREADYDVNSDPVVRIVAGEIRKRLAQYYVTRPNELRIQLPPGGYSPEFCWPDSLATSDTVSSDWDPHGASFATPAPGRSDIHHMSRWKIYLTALTICLMLGSGIWLLRTLQTTSVDRFWQPFLTSKNVPIVCLPDITYFGSPSGTQTLEIQDMLSRKALFSSASVAALNQISNILAGKRGVYVRNSALTSLADLRDHPAILIGGIDNPWSLRAMQHMRFQIGTSGVDLVREIRDRQDPNRFWRVNVISVEGPKTYGIVARFRNDDTGQPTMLIAGVGTRGTIAAAEFATVEANLKSFTDGAPADWEKRNSEILIESQVINGEIGPPHVIATYYW